MIFCREVHLYSRFSYSAVSIGNNIFPNGIMKFQQKSYGGDLRGVLENKCARQPILKTVNSKMGHFLTIKCINARVNVNILASAIVPFRPTAVQVPNLALT